jgi:hypothetical protein
MVEQNEIREAMTIVAIRKLIRCGKGEKRLKNNHDGYLLKS